MKTIKNVSGINAMDCLECGGRAWDHNGDELRIKDGGLECHHWCPVDCADHYLNTYIIRPALPDVGEGYELCEWASAEDHCYYLLDKGKWSTWELNPSVKYTNAFYRRKIQEPEIKEPLEKIGEI